MDTTALDLTLRSNNLFRNGEIIAFNDGTGEMLLLREPLDIVPSVNDTYYPVKRTDMLYLIAWNQYKPDVTDASKFWWVLADANQIYDPFDLTDYMTLNILIPNISNTLLNLQ